MLFVLFFYIFGTKYKSHWYNKYKFDIIMDLSTIISNSPKEITLRNLVLCAFALPDGWGHLLLDRYLK
jgi:hypothetical protein